MDVALVSCLKLPEPDVDAEPLAIALKAAGIDAEILAWDDPQADFSRARLCILRTPWNYALTPDAFLRWVARTDAVTGLLNPRAVLEWNLHKRYLLDLDAAGVPTAPTVLVERGATTTLEEIRSSEGWGEVVIKPAVSAGSWKTFRVEADDTGVGEGHLRALAAERDVLVQPYLRSVEGHGERAIVCIEGTLTHAVRKTPRFSGQDEHVSHAALQISDAEAALAMQALAVLQGPAHGASIDRANKGGALPTIHEPLLYARIDVAPGPHGELVVMELELAEPSLFFCQSPDALALFVAAIQRRLASS